MKKKSFSQKLSLKKETITNLNKNGMINAKGGVNPTNTYCNTLVCPQLDEPDLSEIDGTRCYAETALCSF